MIMLLQWDFCNALPHCQHKSRHEPSPQLRHTFTCTTNTVSNKHLVFELCFFEDFGVPVDNSLMLKGTVFLMVLLWSLGIALVVKSSPCDQSVIPSLNTRYPAHKKHKVVKRLQISIFYR